MVEEGVEFFMRKDAVDGVLYQGRGPDVRETLLDGGKNSLTSEGGHKARGSPFSSNRNNASLSSTKLVHRVLKGKQRVLYRLLHRRHPSTKGFEREWGGGGWGGGMDGKLCRGKDVRRKEMVGEEKPNKGVFLVVAVVSNAASVQGVACCHHRVVGVGNDSRVHCLRGKEG